MARRSIVAVAVECAASKYPKNLVLLGTGLRRRPSLVAGKHAPWGPPAMRGPPIHRGGLGNAYWRFFAIASILSMPCYFHESFVPQEIFISKFCHPSKDVESEVVRCIL